MHLPVTVEAATIERKYVERFSRLSRVARQHMNVALLTQHMNARCQKLRIVRTVRRVTVQAIFAHRRMVPEKRPAFFRMAGVTHIIDGNLSEHPTRLAAMRIVAGGAPNFHVAKFRAKQMGGALEQSLSLLNVAPETDFFNRWCHQQMFRQSRTKNLRYLGVRLIGEV